MKIDHWYDELGEMYDKLYDQVDRFAAYAYVIEQTGESRTADLQLTQEDWDLVFTRGKQLLIDTGVEEEEEDDDDDTE